MAKKHIKLLVDGVYTLDVFDANKLPFAIDLGLESETNYSKRGGAFSKEFNVPATKNNDFIADYILNYAASGSTLDAVTNTSIANQVEGNSPIAPISGASASTLGYNQHTLEIVVNGLTEFYGQIQLKSGLGNKQGKEYSFVFYGNNSDWSTYLKDKSLKLLTGLSSIEWWTSAVQAKQASSVATLQTEDYHWLIINYGKWGSYWNEKFGTALTDNEIHIEDYRPSFRIAAILREIFRQLNYEIESDFINGNFFSQLYMPYCAGDWKPQNIIKSSIQVRNSSHTFGGITSWFDFNLNVVDKDINNDWDVSLKHYTIPQTIGYIFNISIENTDLSIFDIRVFNHTTNAVIPFSDGTTLKVIVNSTTGITETHTLETSYILLNASDLISLQYRNPAAPDASITFTSTQSDLYMSGMSIDANTALPDKNQLEFVSGVCHLFNLIIDTNTQTRKVKIEPRDEATFWDGLGGATRTYNGFYDQTKNAEDWTQKINVIDGKEALTTIVSDLPSILHLGYKKDGSDAIVRALEDQLKQDLYKCDFVFGDITKYAKGEVENLNPFFAPTHHIADRVLASPLAEISASRNYIYLPRIWSGEADPSIVSVDGYLTEYPIQTFQSEPRIVFFKGGAGIAEDNVSSTSNQRCINLGTSTYDHPAISYAVNCFDETGQDPSLSYCSEIVGVSNKSLIYGLLFNYHLHNLAVWRDGIKVDAEFNLKSTDIAGIDFTTLKRLKDQVFYLINLQNYNPFLETLTKCLLMREKATEYHDFSMINPIKTINDSKWINGLKTKENYL